MKDYGMKRFEGKTVFVTGGGGYIGGVTAERFAAEGANVVIADVNEQAMAAVVEKNAEKLHAVCFDITDSASVDRAVADTVEKFGKLDVMVHCAGGSARAKMKALIEQSDEVIDHVLKMNLYGAFYADRAAARVMVHGGIRGRIVNFASTVGFNGLFGCTDYAASKGGIMSMTKALAKELGKYGITANCVAPGVVARPGDNHNDHYKYDTNFLHECCTAEDIASLTLYLASDEARFITGQTYIVDGGRTLAMKGSDV